MMFQTLHILLLLMAVAMVTERVTAACLKMKLKEFKNKYNTVQDLQERWYGGPVTQLRPSCCDRDMTDRYGSVISSPKDSHKKQVGLNFCADNDQCDHDIDVNYAVNGVSGTTGWADVEFGGHTTFGNWIGDINNNNIKACSEFQRKVYSDNSTRTGEQVEYVMPDVDVNIVVNDIDDWPSGNDFVTQFKARIHPMRFASGRQRLCLYANFKQKGWRMTYRPDQGCTEAPYWIKVDFELETNAEEKRILNYPLWRNTSRTTGPFCSIVIVQEKPIYGCMKWG